MQHNVGRNGKDEIIFMRQYVSYKYGIFVVVQCLNIKMSTAGKR